MALVVLGTTLLWLCQSKKKACAPVPAPSVPAHQTPNTWDLQRLRPALSPALHIATRVGLCEEFWARVALQHLLGPRSAAGPNFYPKLYKDVHAHTRTHTHTHTRSHRHWHVEGKVR